MVRKNARELIKTFMVILDGPHVIALWLTYSVYKSCYILRKKEKKKYNSVTVWYLFFSHKIYVGTVFNGYNSRDSF